MFEAAKKKLDSQSWWFIPLFEIDPFKLPLLRNTSFGREFFYMNKYLPSLEEGEEQLSSEEWWESEGTNMDSEEFKTAENVGAEQLFNDLKNKVQISIGINGKIKFLYVEAEDLDDKNCSDFKLQGCIFINKSSDDLSTTIEDFESTCSFDKAARTDINSIYDKKMKKIQDKIDKEEMEQMYLPK